MPKLQGDLKDEHVGRHKRGRRVTSSLAEINVVPLVDVMLVMLIIFMVTAPMMQRGIDVSLPVSARSQPVADERVFVTLPLSYREDRQVMVGDDVVPLAVLHERIRQALLTHSDKEVFVRSDGGLEVQALVDVMDKLREGGVDTMTVVTDVPPRR